MIKLLRLAYIQLLIDPYEYEVTFREQNPSLKQGRYNVLKTVGALQKLGGQKPKKDRIFNGFGSIILENM